METNNQRTINFFADFKMRCLRKMDKKCLLFLLMFLITNYLNASIYYNLEIRIVKEVDTSVAVTSLFSEGSRIFIRNSKSFEDIELEVAHPIDILERGVISLNRITAQEIGASEGDIVLVEAQTLGDINPVIPKPSPLNTAAYRSIKDIVTPPNSREAYVTMKEVPLEKPEIILRLGEQGGNVFHLPFPTDSDKIKDIPAPSEGPDPLEIIPVDLEEGTSIKRPTLLPDPFVIDSGVDEAIPVETESEYYPPPGLNDPGIAADDTVEDDLTVSPVETNETVALPETGSGVLLLPPSSDDSMEPPAETSVYFLKESDLHPPPSELIPSSDAPPSLPKEVPREVRPTISITSPKDVVKSLYSLPSGKYIQIGVFAERKNVKNIYQNIGSDYSLNTISTLIGDKTLFKCLIGPLASSEVSSTLSSLKRRGFKDAFSLTIP